ncbi:DUF5666 domain-containing protein [Ideonella sp.]|uniref:DUF5666 domain-containing protein n=1 Tax=Ideonella sp. TaxID=1929293 RepID=UPI003BB7E937
MSGLAALVALLGACGGGGVEGGGTGTAQAYSQGPITGFGSIIVNGVHYDESTASVLDDDGTNLGRDGLKLGMTVEIDSGGIDATALTAKASTVRVASDLIGPVAASDTTAGTLTVLGQTVKVTASTLFDSRFVGGQAGVSTGQVVEVYAIYDPVSGSYAARLIEPKSNANQYKLRGLVSALDTAARTFRIGSQGFAYAAGSEPAGLANGATLKLKLQTTPNGAGLWVVSSGSQGVRKPADGSEVEIESVVASYSSLGSFVVSGIRVDASGASLKPAGAVVAAGVRVEVEGKMAGDVLVATKLEVKGAEDSSGGDDSGDGQEFEIKGSVSALDTAAKTLVIRGQSISYAGSVAYEDGTEADLAVGKTLEVKGTLAAGGTVVQATEIKFD